MSEPRSPGELLLAAYLRDRGLAFDFEPLVEGAHPDFVVEHPVGRLVLDVFEPELRLTDGGWVDPYAPLRRIFESRKRHQASAAARSGLPFVHVLAETNMAVPIETMFLVGALFGDIQVQVPPGPGGFDPAADARFGTGRNRRLQPTMNTSVSAVAVVRAFNPTLAAFERRAHDSLRAPDDLDGAAVEWAIAREEHRSSMEADGTYEPSARRVWLLVLHNDDDQAAFPLSLEAFGGAYDQQWARFADEQYAVVAEGRFSRDRSS